MEELLLPFVFVVVVRVGTNVVGVVVIGGFGLYSNCILLIASVERSI